MHLKAEMEVLCPFQLPAQQDSLLETGEIIKAMMLTTMKRRIAQQPEVFSTPQRHQSRKRNERR